MAEVAKRSKTTLLYHSKGQSTHNNERNDDPGLVRANLLTEVHSAAKRSSGRFQAPRRRIFFAMLLAHFSERFQ
jgi:hypothetical protein